MPELPEVETIARGVDDRVRGDRILEVWLSRFPQPFKTPRERQAAGLEGRTILAVHRTGKHIVFELGRSEAGRSVVGGKLAPPTAREKGDASSGRRNIAPEVADGKPAAGTHSSADAEWIVHLGMTGRLLVTSPESEIAPHTHARLTLHSGKELRFVDARRFGRLEFRELGGRNEFGAPGAEPLRIGAREFAAQFHGRRLAIKAALLNQSLLAGVGNIYADESLFQAGIRPRRRCNRLTLGELERLRVALRQVLNRAIRMGGSSVADYVDADGARGFFQLEHCVYQRTGEPCRQCKTAIRRVVVAGRGTHYCPKCQR